MAHTHEVAGSIPAPAIMADEIENAITQNAQGPQSAEADGVQHDQHTPAATRSRPTSTWRSKAAGRNPAAALTRVKIVPPGTV